MANLIRLKQLESSSALLAAAGAGSNFSQSVINVMTSNVAGLLPTGVISGSTQLDGTTIKNLTISTTNADKYSLVISGAVAVVDATGLTGSIDGDIDTRVPAQIYLVSGSVPPTDPYVSGSEQSNIIDQGEW
jgi:hypothetical protein